MQGQTQAAGQHGQIPQVFKGGVHLSKKGVTCFKPWHSDNDLILRREIFSYITKLVQKHGVENRLPATIAHDLEKALYSDASSKEEYANLITLERRICSLMLRLRNSQKAAQNCALPGSVTLETLLSSGGFPTAPLLSTSNSNYANLGAGRVLSTRGGPRVLLNTGDASTASAYDVGWVGPISGFNTNLFASTVGQLPCSDFGGLGFENKELMSGACLPKAGSLMIPTPGLNAGSGQLSSTLMNACNGSADKIRQQLLATEATEQTLSGASLCRDASLSNSVELANIGIHNGVKVMRPEQMFGTNGSTLNSSLCYSNMKQGFVQVPFHYSHPVNQSLPQQQVYGGDMYRLKASDIMENRSFQNSTKPTIGCASPSSLVQIPGNLIPIHSDANLSQNLQFSGTDTLPNSPISIISQEHQQPGRSLVISNSLGFSDSDANGPTTNASPLLTTPSVQDIIVDMQDQQFYLLQHNHHTEQALANTGNQLYLQSESQSLQKHSLQVLSMDQQSEQTCQASSTDTGQSEVVSNDSLVPSQVKSASVQDHSSHLKRQRWLLVLFWHVNRCTNTGQCPVPHCESGHALWRHLFVFRKNACPNHRCSLAKQLLSHHKKCRDLKCAVCGPVRSYVSPHAMVARCKLKMGQIKQSGLGCVRGPLMNEAESPPLKRVRLERLAPGAQQKQQLPSMSTIASPEEARSQDTTSCTKYDFLHTLKGKGKDNCGLPPLKVESPTESSVSAVCDLQGVLDSKYDQVIKVGFHYGKEGSTTVASGSEIRQMDQKAVLTVVPHKTEKPITKKVSGITYLESLTAQQIREHILSLRKWIGQSKVKAEKNQVMEGHISTSACSACAVEALHFDPIPVFCTQCGCRIKRNAIYHSSGSGENSLNFCGPCYNAIRFDMVETDGFKVQKSALEKKKNDERRVEAWVECDKCKKWQHQICALFNARINKERLEYICPECCLDELEEGERVPQAANSVLGAKDLPSTILSDFVEERLAWKLEHERAERAKAVGKCPEEVPTAEGLVVRVISSVDKKLEVKSRFWEIFQQQDYPKDFLYKSKMLMLFQEIEGVEVCLFGMYVQEFGAECPQPNHRHVYISYLDSVKYFRPDVRTLTGEALRTFVYHEILIAYLDYCKRRGFSSCYIWACPPLKGDDYILYCHPEIQKTPKTDKLREWYLSMITKAKKENIVTANKNLYDYFFTSSGECKAKVTAAQLPYFDGDYWPGAAEDILQQLQEEEEGLHTTRRGKTKKVATKRTTKTSAQADTTGNTSKDLQLMNKLGQSIMAMKEDFIMVHLHHACACCRNFIISGLRWVCQLCGDNFQLCARCHDEQEKLGEDERHPVGKKECHLLVVAEVRDVPSNTVDRDEIMECEYFDNRQAFLSLCQGNQYQYDTLRRAKHSSMMILYHLHNPNAPAFISSCNICQNELEAGRGWKCKTCSDFDVCNECYSSKEVERHPHKFVARTIPADQNAANADARKQRMLQLRMMLELLVHASKCRDVSCQFAKCRNMKDLFRHGFSCSKRATGGCSLCKRQWFLLTTHARSCKESVCTVPRCMDLRKHLRRAQLQQESRRRAAVNEMIRQRAAEAAGGH